MSASEEIKSEIHRTVLLLHPDPILRGVLESWCAGAKDEEVLVDLKNWNEAKSLEMHEWLTTLTGKELDAVERKLGEYQASKAPERKAA
jgi:hypothetical protein